MKAKDNSSLVEFTRGSEIWVHQLKMFIASVMNVILFGLFATVVIVGLYVYLKIDSNQITAFGIQYDIWLRSLLGNKDALININYQGKHYELTIAQAQKYIDPTITIFKRHVIRALLLGVVTSALIGGGLVYYWFSYGKKVMSDEQIRGSELVDNKELRLRIKNDRGFSPYIIAGIPLLKGTEGTNIGIVGSPGSGKSQVFRDLISQVRNNKRKAIIYDPSGEFAQEFYRPDKDIILNPFDARMPFWTPYMEIENDEHFDSIPQAFISVDAKEPFFGDAARYVMAEVMRELYNQNQLTNKALHDTISKLTLKELSSLLEGTAAAKYVDPKNEKTVSGVLMTVQNKLRAFRYLPDSGTPFSIRKWVKKADEDSFVFLSLRDEQKSTIEPLVALWFTVFIKAVMNLDVIHKERLWLFLDEIPTLPKMDIMLTSLTNTRKFGLCHVLGFQDLPLLDNVYGEKASQSMISALQTKLFMRVNENNTAKRMSEILGQMEVAEKNMSRSMGANDSRDGDSFITQRRERYIVLPSEIMKLPDLIGYLRIPGNFPVTIVKQTYTPHAKNQLPFVEREMLSFKLKTFLNDAEQVEENIESKVESKVESTYINLEDSFEQNSFNPEATYAQYFDDDFNNNQKINLDSQPEYLDEEFANSTQPITATENSIGADPHQENLNFDSKMEEENEIVQPKSRLSTFQSYIEEDEQAKQLESDTKPVVDEHEVKPEIDNSKSPNTEVQENEDKMESFNARNLTDYFKND